MVERDGATLRDTVMAGPPADMDALVLYVKDQTRSLEARVKVLENEVRNLQLAHTRISGVIFEITTHLAEMEPCKPRLSLTNPDAPTG